MMPTKQWLAIAAWLLLPIAAAAQQEQAGYTPATPATPADAHAPVHAVPYESAFEGYRSSGDEQAAPDKVWRAANDEMGRLGGHAGHMKSGQSRPSASSHVEKAEEKQGTAVDHGKHH